MQARDIMNTDFHVVHPEDSIAAAALQFEVASGKEGRKVFGLMVVDDSDHLVGMLSMYDILIFLQPKNMQVWGEMEDMNPDRLFDASLDKVRGVQVGDIMTPDVVTVTPHAHILAVSDIMIKKHIRRLPVIDGNKIVGIVYVSDVFRHLSKKISTQGAPCPR